MSDENPKENIESVESEEEGWKSVGDTGGPAPVTKPVEDAEESHVYKGRATAPTTRDRRRTKSGMRVRTTTRWLS